MRKGRWYRHFWKQPGSPSEFKNIVTTSYRTQRGEVRSGVLQHRGDYSSQSSVCIMNTWERRAFSNHKGLRRRGKCQSPWAGQCTLYTCPEKLTKPHLCILIKMNHKKQNAVTIWSITFSLENIYPRAMKTWPEKLVVITLIITAKRCKQTKWWMSEV